PAPGPRPHPSPRRTRAWRGRPRLRAHRAGRLVHTGQRPPRRRRRDRPTRKPVSRAKKRFFSQLRERRTADRAELLVSRQQTGVGRGRRGLYVPAGWLGGVWGRKLAARAPGGRRWLVVELEALAGVQRVCSGCGTAGSPVHDSSLRRIRDLPVFEDPVELLVPRLRLACGGCGPRLERLDWLDPHARVTRRLAENVARLCAVTSIRQAARWYGLDWKTVKRIDFRYLERTLGPVDLSGVRVIAMDEFAIQKGHRYATVVVDPERKRVLWVGRGRSRAEVRPFFELLGPEGCQA